MPEVKGTPENIHQLDTILTQIGGKARASQKWTVLTEKDEVGERFIVVLEAAKDAKKEAE